MFIYEIIHNLKHITAGIKTCKQEFVVKSLNETVKKRTYKSPSNIILCDAMFECGIIESVDCKHPLHYTSSRKKINERMKRLQSSSFCNNLRIQLQIIYLYYTPLM